MRKFRFLLFVLSLVLISSTVSLASSSDDHYTVSIENISGGSGYVTKPSFSGSSGVYTSTNSDGNVTDTGTYHDTTATLRVDFNESMTFYYDWDMSSEPGYDILYIYLIHNDVNQTIATLSTGDSTVASRTNCSIEVAKGDTVQFCYVKDQSQTCKPSNITVTDTVTITFQTANSHSYGTDTLKSSVAPDCTHTGSNTYEKTCSICGHVDSHTDTVAAKGHSPAQAVTEYYYDPDCTNEGGYDSVVYCSDCGAELSRDSYSIPANGHSNGAAVEENRTEPDCVNEGSYDSVTYCTVCGEETSRNTVTIPAKGHSDSAAVEENHVDPTCTEVGGYDMVTYCSVCGEETSRNHTVIPANGHGTPVLTGAVQPTMDSEGYTGDYICPVCGDILQKGVAIKKLEAADITPDNIVSFVDSSVNMSEETKEKFSALAEDSQEAAVAVVDTLNKTATSLKDALKSGAITKEQYATYTDTVDAAAEAAIGIGSGAKSAAQEGAELQDVLSENIGIDMGSLVAGFYEKQFAEVLNRKDTTGFVHASYEGGSDEGVLDLTISADTYRNATEFVTDSVEKMQDAALMLRECSGEKVTASINQYIDKLYATTFQDFDKEAADEAFVQAAYQAILINMQAQVKDALTESYETSKSSGSFVGTALTKLEEDYNEQMAEVEDIESFEIMVLEVLRMKYNTVLSNQYADAQITKDEYNAATEQAKDVETFKPIYTSIFRSWALNQPSEYGMTLEELTTATIEETTKVTQPSAVSINFTAKDIAVLGGFAGTAMIAYGIFMLIKLSSKSKEVGA